MGFFAEQKGQPLFVPGSMDSKTWKMAGKTKSKELNFESTVQGGGRALRPLATKRKFCGGAVKKPLERSCGGSFC